MGTGFKPEFSLGEHPVTAALSFNSRPGSGLLHSPAQDRQ